MTRAALYTRVSTDDQAKDGFSLGAQEDRLRAHAKAQGWKVAGVYVDDGFSGRTINRPAYRRMMAEKDSWDVVLVLKMDRIHRKSRNFLDMIEALQADGKEFASVLETLDTATAMGRFVMGILQGIAQLESEQTGERTLIGMTQKAKSKQGGLGGPAPFGYRWDQGLLVKEPSEAEAVEFMFKYADGGPAGVAAGLNQHGWKTRSGKPWTYWNVKAILENPVYKGRYVWNDIVQKGVVQEAYV